MNNAEFLDDLERRANTALARRERYFYISPEDAKRMYAMRGELYFAGGMTPIGLIPAGTLDYIKAIRALITTQVAAKLLE